MKSLIFAIIISFLLVFTFTTPVYAIGNPSSITIESVRMFQNLWETGDVLAVIEYKVMYDPDPEEDPQDTYLVAVANATSGAILWSRPLDYYDHNFISIYMDAAETVTWGGNYSIKLLGNPAYFDTITEGTNMKTLALSPGYWIAGDQDTSRLYLADWSISLAETFEISWGITLLTSNDRLNSTGAIKFREAIPGLDSICSEIFGTSQAYPEEPSGNFTATYETLLKAKIGTRLENAVNGLGGWILGKGGPDATAGALVGGVGLFVLFFILAGRIFTATGSVPTAIVCAIPFVFAGNIIGILPLSITFVAAFLILTLFGVTFILGRMG